MPKGPKFASCFSEAIIYVGAALREVLDRPGETIDFNAWFHKEVLHELTYSSG